MRQRNITTQDQSHDGVTSLEVENFVRIQCRTPWLQIYSHVQVMHAIKQGSDSPWKMKLTDQSHFQVLMNAKLQATGPHDCFMTLIQRPQRNGTTCCGDIDAADPTTGLLHLHDVAIPVHNSEKENEEEKLEYNCTFIQGIFLQAKQ
eukprot:scaffold24236_cov49-Attheya_sp.AAC.1